MTIMEEEDHLSAARSQLEADTEALRAYESQIQTECARLQALQEQVDRKLEELRQGAEQQAEAAAAVRFAWDGTLGRSKPVEIEASQQLESINVDALAACSETEAVTLQRQLLQMESLVSASARRQEELSSLLAKATERNTELEAQLVTAMRSKTESEATAAESHSQLCLQLESACREAAVSREEAQKALLTAANERERANTLASELSSLREIVEVGRVTAVEFQQQAAKAADVARAEATMRLMHHEHLTEISPPLGVDPLRVMRGLPPEETAHLLPSSQELSQIAELLRGSLTQLQEGQRSQAELTQLVTCLKAQVNILESCVEQQQRLLNQQQQGQDHQEASQSDSRGCSVSSEVDLIAMASLYGESQIQLADRLVELAGVKDEIVSLRDAEAEVADRLSGLTKLVARTEFHMHQAALAHQSQAQRRLISATSSLVPLRAANLEAAAELDWGLYSEGIGNRLETIATHLELRVGQVLVMALEVQKAWLREVTQQEKCVVEPAYTSLHM